MPTYSHLVSELRRRHPDLAYIHVVEPRVDGVMDKELHESKSNDFLRSIWGNRPFISAGGHTRESGTEFADKYGDLIAYGRLFISNVSGYSVSSAFEIELIPSLWRCSLTFHTV